MKKITLSNLINMTKEEICNLKENDPISVDELILFLNNDYKIYQTIQAYQKNYTKKLSKGNFNYTLAVKGCLNIVNLAIKKYTHDCGRIILDSNDKIFTANQILVGMLEA